ncbi:hypothetical protein X566_17830 [Afipia sp. P52-10]|uniref:hypothetical protein n=1 Tax=Afipia sp. P52-10 TaxID=1429916 RepID=UPI0003DF1EA8|nr:hypothetical protein [Afipia sp. P52-10]ETR76387.1 hypothetical protein X566_17830 [Afipia sp. P52-10]
MTTCAASDTLGGLFLFRFTLSSTIDGAADAGAPIIRGKGAIIRWRQPVNDLPNSKEAEIKIPCPHCGHEMRKQIGWLRANATFTCPGCKRVHFETSKLIAALERAQRAFRQLRARERRIHQEHRAATPEGPIIALSKQAGPTDSP